MTEVSLIHTSGGLLGDVFTDALRNPAIDQTNGVLAEIATFTGPDGRPPTRAQYDADYEATYRAGVSLWASYADELQSGMDTPRLRERLIIPFLRSLGFEPTYQRSRTPAGDNTWGITHFGWADDPDAPPLILTNNVDLDARAGAARSPHEELQGYLNNTPVRWGMICNGRVIRILRDYHHTRTRGYIEIDVAGVFQSGSQHDFLALYRLTHTSRFHPETTSHDELDNAAADSDEEADAAIPSGDEAGPINLLEQAYRSNLDAGVAAGKRLQPQVRFAIQEIANGLADATPGLRQQLLGNPDTGRDFYREILTNLYRILFLLLAEQRAMLTTASPLYEQTYSLTALRERVEAGDYEPSRHDLWAGLQTTFRVFSDPELAAHLNIYPYNGALFDPNRTPLTRQGRCSNEHIATAIRHLTTVEVGRLRMHIDYRNLGVEELGTVYESLLDYTLTIATAITVDPITKTVIPANRLYLAPLSVERADMGAYYTPAELVDLLLGRSIDPLIEERLEDAGSNREAREHALLSLKVLDPACGSAAILIGALDRIAIALATVRSAPQEPPDTEVALARRDVLTRCIYGVDKDPFAVELAKVALWIHCVVPDQPLSFLDAHIVCGDALVGWPLLDLPDAIPNDAYKVPKASRDDKHVLNRARERNQELLKAREEGSGLIDYWPAARPDITLPPEMTTPDNTWESVRQKARVYKEWKSSADYRRWDDTANLWTAAFFWTAEHGDAPTSLHYSNAIGGDINEDLAREARMVLQDLNPLHWPLAFPEVRTQGGFDIIIGNPPWEESASIEQEFFAQSAPHVAALSGAERSAAIAYLQQDDPELFGRWAQYRSNQERFAHYAKTCGRFTRTSGKVNTYVLFTEVAAEHADRAGVIVKSGIATDLAQNAVWTRLLSQGRVQEVRDMVNSSPTGSRVFPAVAAVERFSILALSVRMPDRVLRASTLNFGVAQASEGPLRDWTMSDLSAVAPRSRTLLSSRNNGELDLAVELQRRFSTLDFVDSDGRNPWGISYHTLFNSHYVHKDGLAFRAEHFVGEGFAIGPDKVFRHPDGRTAVPLLEGQMVNRWDHRARTYEGYTGTNKYGRKPHIPWVTDEQHANPNFENEPRYWMLDRDAERRIREVADDKWLIAMRDVGAVFTNRRSMRCALIGRYPATDTLPVLAVPPETAMPFVALVNSMTFDFLVRCHIPGGHLKPWIVSQCAAPDPLSVPSSAAALAESLSVTSLRLGDLTGRTVTTWDTGERELWDAEIDAQIAVAYRLSWEEYEVVLDHFAPLRRAEDKQFGEYKSKRLRLEAFDRLSGKV